MYLLIENVSQVSNVAHLLAYCLLALLNVDLKIDLHFHLIFSMQQGKMFFFMGTIMALVQGECKVKYIFLVAHLIFSYKRNSNSKSFIVNTNINNFTGGYVRRIPAGKEVKIATVVS